jgi:NAD+ synthase
MSELKTSPLKIALAQINPTVGDIDGNAERILAEFKKAESQNCDLVVFGELAICGYKVQDLLRKKYFISEIKEKIIEILEATKGSKCAILVGAPTFEIGRSKNDVLYNSAILLEDGEIKHIAHKKTLPNYGVFDEKRYFEASNSVSYVEFRGQTLAILICEDLWDKKNLFLLSEQIFDTIISINASPYSQNKSDLRLQTAKHFAKTLKKPLIYVNLIGGQDELVFDGASMVLNQSGEIILKAKEFEEDLITVEVTKDGNLNYNLPLTPYPLPLNNKNYSACVLGLRDYVLKNGFKKVILGMSGGIDSAIVAAIAVDALGAENVTLYALPSRFNSETSMIDAVNCAKNLNVKLEVISIEEPLKAMLSTLGEISQLAKENLQSRIRGNILMAISNSSGALLLSTGNKSEMATGYATLYGDMCGAFNPIKDLYKTEIYELAKYRNSISEVIPHNILTKAPTAELRENQKDSDSLPEYDILDKILFSLIEEEKSVAEIISLGFEESLVKKVAKLFYQNEYKRQQSCLGVKISEKSFDLERRYPITNKFTK